MIEGIICLCCCLAGWLLSTRFILRLQTQTNLQQSSLLFVLPLWCPLQPFLGHHACGRSDNQQATKRSRPTHLSPHSFGPYHAIPSFIIHPAILFSAFHLSSSFDVHSAASAASALTTTTLARCSASPSNASRARSTVGSAVVAGWRHRHHQHRVCAP